jgi:hypothetical protein
MKEDTEDPEAIHGRHDLLPNRPTLPNATDHHLAVVANAIYGFLDCLSEVLLRHWVKRIELLDMLKGDPIGG